MFFVCVYLLPSLCCEERERGVLLAQALSPASPREILAARFLFYPVLGLSLAAVLAGTYRPAVLASPFFWLALVVAVCGSPPDGLPRQHRPHPARRQHGGDGRHARRRPAAHQLPAERHPRPALPRPGVPLPAHAPRRPDRQRAVVSLAQPRRRCP